MKQSHASKHYASAYHVQFEIFLILKRTYRKVFTKILNYTMSSCMIFYTRASQYPQYTYWLQEQSTYFGLKASTQFDLVITEQFGKIHNYTIKIIQKISVIFTKIF